VVESTWKEFADAGLFWWVNRGLHLFGWVLVREENEDGSISRVYPARTRYRGFEEKLETEGFQKLTAHLLVNAPDLLAQTKE
jgi:hypothetical protein